jgi:hypothetical protein
MRNGYAKQANSGETMRNVKPVYFVNVGVWVALLLAGTIDGESARQVVPLRVGILAVTFAVAALVAIRPAPGEEWGEYSRRLLVLSALGFGGSNPVTFSATGPTLALLVVLDVGLVVGRRAFQRRSGHSPGGD